MNSRIKLLILGRNPEYFLKKIIRKNINIYEIDKKSRSLIIVINSSDLESIQSIKTSYSLKIIDRYGVNRFIYLFKNYYVYIIGFLLGFLFLLFLNSFIVDVKVIHSNNYIKKLVYNDLKYYGIKKFSFKKNYKEKENIRLKILKKEKNDLEWMEISQVGSKYIIKVEQRKLNKKEDHCYERNIVASKKAMIIDIYATSGEVVKKKYDYVNKGDVIISGLIHNNDYVMSKKCSKGNVVGEVWYLVTINLPRKYREEKFTGRESKNIGFKFLNKEKVLFNEFDTYTSKNILSISEDILPISFNFSKYREISIIKKNYTINNCSRDALKIAGNRLSNKLKKNSRIISKKVLKKVAFNSRIEVDVFIKVYEDITDYQDITNIDINELNQDKE